MWVGDQRHVHTAEGNGPVNAIDKALRAAARRRLPGSSTGSTSPTSRCASSTAPAHRRRHAGAARRHRRRARLDDHRRQREHHRGVVAGARGEHRLRPAPRRGRGSRRTARTRRDGRAQVRPGRRRPATSSRIARRTTCPTGGRPTAPASSPAASRAARARLPGPDQGYALPLASRLRPQLVLSDAERADDALTGCTAIGMRRASMFGRAPVIHDLRIAFTIWGFLDPAPPAELVALRVGTFEGVADPPPLRRRAGARRQRAGRDAADVAGRGQRDLLGQLETPARRH